MDTNNYKDKILAIEDEFMKIGDTLHCYLNEVRVSHEDLINEQADLKQQLHAISPFFESAQSNILALKDEITIVKQHIQQLEKKFPENQNSAFPPGDALFSSIEDMKDRASVFEENLQKVSKDILDLSKKLDKSGHIEIEDTPKILAKINNQQTILDTIQNSIGDIQTDSANQRSAFFDLKDKFSIIEDNGQKVNHAISQLDEITATIEKNRENQENICNTLKTIENSMALRMDSLSERLDNENSQMNEINNHLVELKIDSETQKNENARFNQILSENFQETKGEMSTVSNQITGLSERLETQEQSLQQLQSVLDERILKINDTNTKLQSQNTILFIAALFFAALAGIITVILI